MEETIYVKKNIIYVIKIVIIKKEHKKKKEDALDNVNF